MNDHGERRAVPRGEQTGPDPLRTYADLYHQALECRRRVDLVRSTVSRAAEILDKRPERFRFDGIESVMMPRTVGEPFAAAAAWPTAEQMQQVLADWHAAAANCWPAPHPNPPISRKAAFPTPPDAAASPD